MPLCGVIGAIISTFWENDLVTFRHSSLEYKCEKDELGFQTLP